MKNLRFYPLTLEEVEGVEALAQLVFEAVMDQLEAGLSDWEAIVKEAERAVRRNQISAEPDASLEGLELLGVERQLDETVVRIKMVTEAGEEKVLEVRA